MPRWPPSSCFVSDDSILIKFSIFLHGCTRKGSNPAFCDLSRCRCLCLRTDNLCVCASFPDFASRLREPQGRWKSAKIRSDRQMRFQNRRCRGTFDSAVCPVSRLCWRVTMHARSIPTGCSHDYSIRQIRAQIEKVRYARAVCRPHT